MKLSTQAEIALLSSFSDKGVKQAENSLSGFGKFAADLAKKFAGIFAIDKITSFGVSSVKAFTSINQQLSVLSNTLQNSNGLIIGVDKLDSYFTSISEKFGKQKSDLVPVFETLANATGSLSKSQELLNLTLDISAGTGKDLTSVSMALGKAYNGQMTALERLGVGLSKTTLTSKTFTEIQNTLANKFSGSAAVAADTYAGKIDKIKVAYENAKEVIGSGIIDALSSLSQNGSMTDLTAMFDKIANDIADTVRGLGVIGGWIENHSKVGKTSLFSFANFFPLASYIANLGKKTKESDQASLNIGTNLWIVDEKNYAARKKAADQAARDLLLQKQVTAQKLAQLAAEKAKNVLTAASKVVDVQQAEILAAQMNASLSQDEIDRLNLKKALLDQNATAAAKLAQEILATQAAALQAEAISPFSTWADGAKAALDQIQALQFELKGMGVGLGTPSIAASTALALSKDSAAALADSLPNVQDQYDSQTAAVNSFVNSGSMSVGIDLGGNIYAVTQSNSLAGTPTNISRINPINSGQPRIS